MTSSPIQGVLSEVPEGPLRDPLRKKILRTSQACCPASVASLSFSGSGPSLCFGALLWLTLMQGGCHGGDCVRNREEFDAYLTETVSKRPLDAYHERLGNVLLLESSARALAHLLKFKQ